MSTIFDVSGRLRPRVMSSPPAGAWGIAVRRPALKSVLVAAGLAVLFFTALTASEKAKAQRGRIAPEAASGQEAKTLVTAKRFMVVAAHPLAVAAGYEIIQKGGSAVDAAIAVQMVLNLVEPQSSGIGGGAFLLHYDRETGQVTSFDGRETAPAAAKPDRFLGADGRPLPFFQVVRSGLSVGVPGLIAMLAKAHETKGRLPWADLFAPAIRLATNGFEVTRRLSLSLAWVGPDHFAPEARRYFFPGGIVLTPGTVLKNPEFAKSLRAIAARGPSAFYSGPIAQAMVAAVRRPELAGDLTLDDLQNYQAKLRPPVCFAYRSNTICGMGAPSSGGLTVAQTLKLLAPFDLSARETVSKQGAASPGDPRAPASGDVGGTTGADDTDHGGPQRNAGDETAVQARLPAMHLVAEAEKLAYADRNRYLADPDFVAVPNGYLDDGYLEGRRRQIDPAAAMSGRPLAGRPPGSDNTIGENAGRGRPGTSHISIVDRDGDAVSMTTTIEGAFGSGLWAAGFLLNNELTDFSFRPVDRDGRPMANRVMGGKRPRSSMAPTLVLDADGKLKAVIGSPGGSRIILYVIKALVGVLDWGLDAQQAADFVNFGSRGRAFELEVSRAKPATALRLESLGHDVRPDVMVSGLHIIVVRDGRLEGGADPRREGVAMGD